MDLTVRICLCEGLLQEESATLSAFSFDHFAPPAQTLGMEQGSLAPGHRLDAGTEGLVVLTKGPAFARCRGCTLSADMGKPGVGSGLI